MVEKFLIARGGPVEIQTPSRRQKASKQKVLNVPTSEDAIVRQLAQVTKQRGAEAQKTLDKIAERARLLTFVPENRWGEIIWFDEEDEKY